MVSDESAVMYRIGGFGLAAAIVYWFISYEWLGSVALLTLGVGPLFAGITLGMAERGRLQPEPRVDLVRRLAGFPRPEPKGVRHRLAADRMMIIPTPSVWPFVLSLGLSIGVSGLIFGTWLLLLGGILTVWGLWGWIAAVGRETVLGHLQADAAPPPQPGSPPQADTGDPRHAAPQLPRDDEQGEQGVSAARQQPPQASRRPSDRPGSASEPEPKRVAGGDNQPGR